MTCSHPADPTPSDNPRPNSATCSLRFAVSAGPLTAVLLAQREAEAKRLGRHLLEVMSEAELLHLQFIQRAMPQGSGWDDAAEAIRATRQG